MPEKVVIQTDAAPAPIGPYSQAIKFGQHLYMAGQIALDPKSGKMVGADAAAQAQLILKNIEAIVDYAGLTIGNVVRCVVYVVDLREVPAINKVFADHFSYQPPARTTVQVAALPGGARIEIEATAVYPD